MFCLLTLSELDAPVIFDNNGDFVWIGSQYGSSMDLKVQTYEGNQVLSFFQGESAFGLDIWPTSVLEVSKN